MLLGGIAGYNTFFSTGAGGAAAKTAGIAAQEKVPGLVQTLGLENIYYAIVDPKQLFTDPFTPVVDENYQSTDIGVKIEEFKQIGQAFEHDPIILRGAIRAQGLYDPSAQEYRSLTLTAYCTLEDYEEGKKFPATLDSPFSSGNQVEVLGGKGSEYIEATCEFPQGMSIASTTKVIEVKEAKLLVGYEFETWGYLPLYTLNKKDLYELRKKGESIFEFYAINEPLLNSDDTIQSKASEAPVRLGIGTYQAQPFTDGPSYWLTVTLRNNAVWGGQIGKLSSLEVEIPPGFVMESDPRFGTDTLESADKSCSFEPLGDTTEQDWEIYVLKPELLAKLNKDCHAYTLRDVALTEKQCFDIFKRDMSFNCRMKIIKPVENTQPIQLPVHATARYLYQTTNSAPVKIFKVPTELADNSGIPSF